MQLFNQFQETIRIEAISPHHKAPRSIFGLPFFSKLPCTSHRSIVDGLCDHQQQ